MKRINNLWLLIFGAILISCNDETTDNVDPVVTVTPPATYSFERNGQTTVSYGGQTARLEMAKELGSHLNDETKTKEQLVNMFDNGTGFDNSSLDGSGKKIGNKTASSSIASSTVKAQFNALIDDVVTNVFPAVASSTDASAGTAGIYTDPGDGGRTVKINAKGHEINQLLLKD